MNATSTTGRMTTGRRLRYMSAAGIAVFAMVATSCADDKTDTATSDATTTVKANSGGAGSSTLEPTGPGCAAVPADGDGSFAGMAQNPAATAASANPVLSTLVAAVKAAGLVDTLNGPGPFTIFAPANSAFDKIPKADLDSLLADKAALTKVLTLHVVSGKMSSEELAKTGTATSLQGGELEFTKSGDTLEVNGSKVVCSDVQVSNATVHIIDTVLDTKAASSDSAMAAPTGAACGAVPADGAGSFEGMASAPAATAASANPVLSTLVAAVKAAGLVDTLNGPGPFTIFAPANSAFEQIPKADLDSLLADKAALTKVLTLHVVDGKMSAAELETAGSVDSLEGGKLTITKSGDTFMVNGATAVCQDVQVANATVHIIDTVMKAS